MNNELINKYKYLWDPKEEWVLIRHSDNLVKITVTFSGKSATAHEIIAVKNLLSKDGPISLSKVRELLGDANHITLPIMGAIDAEEHIKYGKELGLNITVKSYIDETYQPYRRRDHMVCLIDDDDLAHQISSEMIKHGVTIIDKETIVAEINSAS